MSNFLDAYHCVTCFLLSVFNFTEEFVSLFNVIFGVNGVGEAVACALYDDKLFLCRASLKVPFAHLAGHEIVGVTVEENARIEIDPRQVLDDEDAALLAQKCGLTVIRSGFDMVIG